jgi:hypothetical protein
MNDKNNESNNTLDAIFMLIYPLIFPLISIIFFVGLIYLKDKYEIEQDFNQLFIILIWVAAIVFSFCSVIIPVIAICKHTMKEKNITGNIIKNFYMKSREAITLSSILNHSDIRIYNQVCLVSQTMCELIDENEEDDDFNFASSLKKLLKKGVKVNIYIPEDIPKNMNDRNKCIMRIKAFLGNCSDIYMNNIKIYALTNEFYFFIEGISFLIFRHEKRLNDREIYMGLKIDNSEDETDKRYAVKLYNKNYIDEFILKLEKRTDEIIEIND